MCGACILLLLMQVLFKDVHRLIGDGPGPMVKLLGSLGNLNLRLCWPTLHFCPTVANGLFQTSGTQEGPWHLHHIQPLHPLSKHTRASWSISGQREDCFCIFFFFLTVPPPQLSFIVFELEHCASCFRWGDMTWIQQCLLKAIAGCFQPLFLHKTVFVSHSIFSACLSSESARLCGNVHMLDTKPM